MYNPHNDPLFCFFVKGQDEVDIKFPYPEKEDEKNKIEIDGIDRTAMINLIRDPNTLNEESKSTTEGIEPKFLEAKNNQNILKIWNTFIRGYKSSSSSESLIKNYSKETIENLSEINVFETFASFGVFVTKYIKGSKKYFLSFLPRYIGYYFLGNLNEDQVTKAAKQMFDLYPPLEQYFGGLMNIDTFINILKREGIEDFATEDQQTILKENDFYILVQRIDEKIEEEFTKKYLSFLLRKVVVEILMRIYKIQKYGPTKKLTDEKKKLSAQENKMKDRLINAKTVLEQREAKIYDKILLDIKQNIPVIELIEVEAENTEIYGKIPLNRGSKSMQTVITSFVQLQNALRKCSLTQECTDGKISGPLNFNQIRSSEEKMKAEENNNNNKMTQMLDRFNCNTDPSETIQKLQDAANYYNVPVPSDRDLESCNTLKKNIAANMIKKN